MAATKESRRLAARLVAGGTSHAEAARSIRIDPRSLRRWLATDPEFVRMVETERNRIAYEEQRTVAKRAARAGIVPLVDDPLSVEDVQAARAELVQPDPFRTVPGQPPSTRELTSEEAYQVWCAEHDYLRGDMTWEELQEVVARPRAKGRREPIIREVTPRLGTTTTGPTDPFEGLYEPRRSSGTGDPFAGMYAR